MIQTNPNLVSGNSPPAVVRQASAKLGHTLDVLADVEESAILAAYQASEKHGLEFGRLLYDYKKRHGAQGRKGEGLAQLLRKLGIKEGKAYYWIDAYKLVLGIPPALGTGDSDTETDTESDDVPMPDISTMPCRDPKQADPNQPPVLQPKVVELKVGIFIKYNEMKYEVQNVDLNKSRFVLKVEPR